MSQEWMLALQVRLLQKKVETLTAPLL